MSGIYDDARHYDLLMPGPNDLPFYQRQVARYGSQVLELACGSGRLTIPLRLSGAAITGLDSAAAMLEEARRKAQRSGAEVEYIHADVRSYSLGRAFQLIFIANNSLSHLLTRDDLEACLRCVRQHLAPDGRFIVDIFTPAFRFLTRDPAQRRPVGQYDDPDGRGWVTVSEVYRYDTATQISHAVWRYERGEDAWEVPLQLRMFFPQEIDALLLYNGFSIEHKYGDFDQTPYGPGAPKQLIVCRAA